jgi:hypothetical protein
MNGFSREEWYEDYMRIMDEEYGDYGFVDDPVVLEELALEEEKEQTREWRSKNKVIIEPDDGEEECNVPAEVIRLRDIKLLKRDVRREMLRRLEQAARTVTDFRNLGNWYDYFEELERHRVRDHEVSRSGDDFPLEYGENEDSALFAGSLSSVISRQMRKGDFLDAIYCKPDTIDELVTTDYMIHFMRAIEDEDRELFYFKALEDLSSTEIAEMRDQTDRAVRKAWKNLLFHLRQRTMGVLIFRSDKDFSFTGDEQIFLDTCRKKYKYRINSVNDS